MRKTAILDWKTMLDDAEWDRVEPLEELLAATAASEPLSPSSGSQLRRTAIAVAFGACLAGAVVLWLTAQNGVAAIEEELGNAIAVENWLQRSQNITATTSLVDPLADPAWQAAYLRDIELASQAGTNAPLEQAFLERTRLRSGLAMVQVTVTDDDGEAYRETRFYCESAAGWQRTSPDDAFWGREQVLETEHFRIRYRQADAQAVMAAAPRLDPIYEQLRADLGLTGEAPFLTVDVAPVTLDALRYLEFENDRLTVPSPLLIQRPADTSDDAVLAETIVHPLVKHVWDEVAAEDADAWSKNARAWSAPMVCGAQMWQGASIEESRGVWLSRASAWLYTEAPVIQAGLRKPATADLNSLCDGQSLWRLNVPVYISLAALCVTPDWDVLLRHMPPAPGTLGELLAVDEMYPYPLPASAYEGWQRNVAAATVVDYFVETYGRDQLPELIDGLRTHDSWDTLIPAVTGVSAAEFEAGWQQFLAHEYGYHAREQ